MNRPRLLLADDHRIVVEGLRSILGLEYELVGIVEDGRELVEAAKRLDPDVIVADIAMPQLNGLEAVAQLRKEGCQAKVVFLTMHKDATYAAKALEIGASGYVLKHSASTELLTAIRAALLGQTYVTNDIAEGLRRAAATRTAVVGSAVTHAATTRSAPTVRRGTIRQASGVHFAHFDAHGREP